MLDCLVVVPARLNSRRLPNKLLRTISGNCTVLESTWRRINRLDYSLEPLVATDSRDIQRECAKIGAKCHYQEGDFPSGTDRVAAACAGLPPETIVVNVQADEAELNPFAIEYAVQAVSHGAMVATIAAPLDTGQALDPNVVKVVLSEARLAMYFSRSLVPWTREVIGDPMQWHLAHIGLYCFKNVTLQNFANWGECVLERLEGLEQLRFLFHGTPIYVQTLGAHTRSVNTECDLLDLQRGLGP